MNPINNAENQVGDAFVNRLIKVERDLNEYKTTPQKIGNGSLNYAIFGAGVVVGPVTIAAGAQINFALTFLTPPITYDSLPAIPRITLFDLLVSVCVDTNDTSAHVFPYGASLTAGQRSMRMSTWCDLYQSGMSEANGRRYMLVQIGNQDSVSHDYYVNVNGIIPRPALKPL